MTYIHTSDLSETVEHEVRKTTWGYDTLRPPVLTPIGLVKDLIWEVHRFRAAGLSVRTAMVFLVLRVLQRVAYNTGWWMGR